MYYANRMKIFLNNEEMNSKMIIDSSVGICWAHVIAEIQRRVDTNLTVSRQLAVGLFSGAEKSFIRETVNFCPSGHFTKEAQRVRKSCCGRLRVADLVLSLKFRKWWISGLQPMKQNSCNLKY
jgi:hypothetical protein